MRPLLRALRFFTVVPPVPRLMTLSFAVLTVLAAIATVVTRPGWLQPAIPLLVLQAFATSSGFAASARRGHYDLLITGGVGRLRTGIAHWWMSALPGAIGCLTVLLVARVRAEGALTPDPAAALTALLLASTLPWAVTVALPRFFGAIGWLLVCTTAHTLAPTGGSQVPAAVAVVLYPITAVADRADMPLATSGPGIATALCAMAAALWWIMRADLPLEASQ